MNTEPLANAMFLTFEESELLVDACNLLLEQMHSQISTTEERIADAEQLLDKALYVYGRYHQRY